MSRSNILVRISHILHCSVHTHIWQISCLHYSPSSTTHLQQFPLLPPQQLCLLNIMAKPNTWGHSTSRKPGFPPTSSTAESYAYISPTPPILSLIGFWLPTGFSLDAVTIVLCGLVLGQSHQELLDSPSYLRWFVLVLYQSLPAWLSKVDTLQPPALASIVMAALPWLWRRQQAFPLDPAPSPWKKTPDQVLSPSVPSHLFHLTAFTDTCHEPSAQMSTGENNEWNTVPAFKLLPAR